MFISSHLYIRSEICFNIGGYYAVEHSSDPKIRIVVVNSNIWSKDNPTTRDVTDPGLQLNWTRSQLEQARQDGYKVGQVKHF